MSDAERAAWHEFVRDKLAAEGPWLGLPAYRARVAALQAEYRAQAEPAAGPAGAAEAATHGRALALLDALAEYGELLAGRYGV